MTTAAKVTPITSRDGSYLAEFVLEKGYVVLGIKRRAFSLNTTRVDHIYQDLHVRNTRFTSHHGDPIRAKQKLDWAPEIIWQDMCHAMVAHDLVQANQHALLKANGYQINASVEQTPK